MGRDKALLTDDGVSLVERVAAVVRAASGSCTLVAPAGRYEVLGIPVLADRWPGEGPLGGILTALEAGDAERNLVVAVDMPNLAEEFLTQLLEEAEQGSETIVPVHDDGEMEPLCCVYHASAAKRLRAFFDAGGRRVKDALQLVPVRTVPAPGRVLANVNTPEQWEAVRG